MTPAELAAALNHPPTLGATISRSIVLMLPIVLLGIGYALGRWERMGASRWLREHLDEVGRAVREQHQRIALRSGTRSWQ